MKLKLRRRKDGTFIGDFQGLDGANLQLTVKSFIKKLPPMAEVEIITDDPETHDTILLALHEWRCKVAHDSLNAGTYRTAVKIC